VEKMSKSLGNYVGISEPPREIFGKLMSISDTLMWRYIELLSFEPLGTVNAWRKDVEGGRNPRDIKVLFAKEIVARFHSTAAAEQAEQEFGKAPADLKEVSLDVPASGLQVTQALKLAGLVPSATEAQRVIEQGGVKIGGERLTDKSLRFAAGAAPVVVQVGKHKFARLSFK
jgi:tyrosyl-tRNA synthetase